MHKIISTFTFCLFPPIFLMISGCMSFYSENNIHLGNYRSYDGELLLKLADSSEINVPKDGISLIKKNEIDSVGVVNVNSCLYYKLYTNDNRILKFPYNDSSSCWDDIDSTFWLVQDKNGTGTKKVSDKDIIDIQTKKIDPVKSVLFISGIGAVAWLWLNRDFHEMFMKMLP